MKFFDKELPEEPLQVLREVQLYFPRAVLAGGAIRDTLFGGPVKDIDIFVPWESWDGEAGPEPRARLHTVMEGWGYHRVLYVSGEAGYATGMRGEVSLVEEYRREGRLPVQIIFLNIKPFSPLRVLNRMDFGACQVGTDGRATFVTYAGLHDYLSRRFTLLRCEDLTQARRSFQRAARFQARYLDAVVDLSLAERVFGLPVRDIKDLAETEGHWPELPRAVA